MGVRDGKGPGTHLKSSSSLQTVRCGGLLGMGVKT